MMKDFNAKNHAADHHNLQNRGSLLMHDRKPFGSLLWAVLLVVAATFGLNGCGNVNDVASTTPPPPQPGPLTILTSSPLPAGTTTVFYDITLAPSGGTPPYTWSLAPGSPALPNGLVLAASTGDISGTPTATGTTLPEFKLKDSTGKSVQKILSIKVNASPTPLAILTNSLTPGTINQPYAFALGGTGGTTPYTWGLKDGSPPLPSGLTLDKDDGGIRGTPTVTSNDTHIFTLTDATSLTVEKSLQLSIKAIPLSITTNSPLPQGTAGQTYSETLAASGGTGNYTWRLAASSPDLPTGLTLNLSTGEISGIPTGTSNNNYTFTVTDQTPPTPQTATKTLRLIIGDAPPPPTITPNSLPSGSVLQLYTFALTTSGGTGTLTWDLANGSLPVGLNLSSAGVISGTPTTAGTSSPTFRVRDSGNPQQSATKQLSITINLPAAPIIQTTSLPNAIFDVPYSQILVITGGTPPLVWGVISGTLPAGLTITSNQISFTPSATGSFTFTVRVTDATNQFDDQPLKLNIVAPPPPTINAFTLPTGTVNQKYLDTQLTATGGALPYTWSVNPALPNGLSLNPLSGVISGTPLSGSNGVTSHIFTVADSTAPINQTNSTGPKSLTINANVTPLTITTSSLPNGTADQAYTAPLLVASGGTSLYNWSLNGGSTLPQGLSLSASGEITGTPTTSGTTSTTFRVQDSTTPNQQSATKSISITINAAPPPLTITTTSPLPAGTEGQAYNAQLQGSGGTPPRTWSVAPSLPADLQLDASTGAITGIPSAASSDSYTFTLQDNASQSVQQSLTLTIDAAPPPLTITTTSLPAGTVGQPYNTTLQASSGTPP